ncbi:hypothetical protein IC582_020049 [Cucumis melo]
MNHQTSVPDDLRSPFRRVAKPSQVSEPSVHRTVETVKHLVRRRATEPAPSPKPAPAAHVKFEPRAP